MTTVTKRFAFVVSIGMVLPMLAGCPEPAEEPEDEIVEEPVEGPAAAPAEEPAAAPAPAPADSPAADATTGHVMDIEGATLGNEDYRRVVVSGEHMQLVLMTLRPGEEIGRELHGDVDQFIRIESGAGRVTLDGESHELEAGSAVVIPAGVEHNVANTGDAPLKLYTIYSPPEHEPGTVQRTKQEAEAARRDR